MQMLPNSFYKWMFSLSNREKILFIFILLLLVGLIVLSKEKKH